MLPAAPHWELDSYSEPFVTLRCRPCTLARGCLSIALRDLYTQALPKCIACYSI